MRKPAISTPIVIIARAYQSKVNVSGLIRGVISTLAALTTAAGEGLVIAITARDMAVAGPV